MPGATAVTGTGSVGITDTPETGDVPPPQVRSFQAVHCWAAWAMTFMQARV
jgi:hypothetical protein